MNDCRSEDNGRSNNAVVPASTLDTSILSWEQLAGAVSEVEDNVSELDAGMEGGADPNLANLSAEPVTVENEDESEYEYEDNNGFSGFLVADQAPSGNSAALDTSEHTRIEEETVKLKEPSNLAASMLLRAERETTGGKRCLALDLYKIMMSDIEAAGFSMQPMDEEKIDKWLIKLFQFDQDSYLAKDMEIVGGDYVELEMSFTDQYPFEPPFVRVVKPKFKRPTGFVMNGFLYIEPLTKEGWNPINDIESVIASIQSLLFVGDGQLAAVTDLPEKQHASISRNQGPCSRMVQWIMRFLSSHTASIHH